MVAAHGWDGLSMERLAAEAGVARATLHRRKATPALVRQALAERAVEVYRTAIWPALTGAGSGRERLTQLLLAMMEASDADLAVLAGLQSIEASPFHEQGDGEMLAEAPFTDPIARLLRDGESDGTLLPCDQEETATVIFNAVGWTYVHLRLSHRWKKGRAQKAVLRLVMEGLSAH